MLVIISDLHLTDGTTGLRIPVDAFRVFRERLEGMAYDASKRADGTYRPIEEFDLVLLGDMFDLLRSTKWTEEEPGEDGYARPWSDPTDGAFLTKIDRITDGILKQNADSLELLRQINAGTAISIPPATRSQQVDRRVSRDRRSKSRLPVKANIHYMIGNHDWMYHLPGEAMDRVRGKVIAAMGLSNPLTPFPHEPSESEQIGEIFACHSVFARHGDIYDPFNYVEERGRDYASIGDALVVELFNRIPQRMRAEMTDEFIAEIGEQQTQATFAALDEMGSVRPSVLTPVWIASLLDRYQIKAGARGKINAIWEDLVDQLLNLDFLDELDQPFRIDLSDKMKAVFRLIKPVTLETLDGWAAGFEKLLNLLKLISGGSELSYEKRAAEEAAYQNMAARFIVYGHTHEFKVYPLRSANLGSKIFGQYYINSGTWHPWHEAGKDEGEQRGFLSHKTMTYLGFYQGDERRGRAYETWNGTLDL